ncbi:MAG: hypothetical protein K0R07_839 [Sedimentibacter sp.]|jgi:hypothetical protein|nr:hypothetical protein [Sedimentibacter sp.]
MKKNYYHLRLIVFFQVNIQLGGTSKNKLNEKTLKGTPTELIQLTYSQFW